MSRKFRPSVYFIYEQNEPCLFKVGQSIRPWERMRNLQTGNSRKLVIYKTIECATKKQAEIIEDSIHIRHAANRVRGEWFTISKNDVDAICAEVHSLRESELIAAVGRTESQSPQLPTLPYIPLKQMFWIPEKIEA